MEKKILSLEEKYRKGKITFDELYQSVYPKLQLTNTNQEFIENFKKQHKLAYKLMIEPSKLMRGFEEITEKAIIGLLTVGQESIENTRGGELSGGCGHVSLVGVPGIGKTTLAEVLKDVLDMKFSRIQFTADMLPAEITGTLIFNKVTNEFDIYKGPIFANIVLGDEINRAPGKVQSATLSAMAENKVIIGDKVFQLDDPFFVVTTENPIEQEGTYPLTEAQLDRFIFRFLVEYISKEEEMKLVNQYIPGIQLEKIMSDKEVVEMRKFIRDRSDSRFNIYVHPSVGDYIVSIVMETRPEQCTLESIKNLNEMIGSSIIEVGASPRASIYLRNASKTKAFLEGRDYVTYADVEYLAYDVLCHRIKLSDRGGSYFLNAYRIDTGIYREDYKAKKMLIKEIMKEVKLGILEKGYV